METVHLTEFFQSWQISISGLKGGGPDSMFGELSMNELLNKKTARLLAGGLDISFLVVHIAMFFIFRSCGVTPMVRFNLFSIVFYIVMLGVIARGELFYFTLGTYLEVVLHMTAAVCFVGTGAGFQVTLVGINILLFYAEYVARCLKERYILSDPLAAGGMVVYLAGIVYSYYCPPRYPLPPQMNFYLQLLWGVVVFFITIAFLRLFVYFTFNSEEILSRKMTHDKLTGLPNRYYMNNYLSVATEKEYMKHFWVAMADIDNFKSINDTYGHNCGDMVLQTVADLLREGCEGAELCRWGGEEFLMVGKLDGDRHAHIGRLERIRRSIEEHPLWYEEQKLKVTITVGISRYEEGLSLNEWINLADQKLYEGKQTGKNKVVS
jgi:diguanylate cyclase (GGDEF)-like protein